MPAFSYAAAIIVAEVGGIVFAAAVGAAGVAFTTSVIALGLAMVTARVLGLTGGAGGTQQDPGVRIQLPPATNNKIPIVYGTANTKGVVTDARISNENKTMTYVLALSEKTQTGAFSVGNIYWNDQKLTFDSIAGNEHRVVSSIDQNGLGSVNTNYNGLIRMRVYSGGVDAANQIFPPQTSGNTVNAMTSGFIPPLEVPNALDDDYNLTDIVFAVVQLDYNSEKGITGLGQLTFQISNTLTNPAQVWYDYMTSNRYGVGIASSQINTTTSISTVNTQSVYSISNEIPPNQFLADGTTPSTQVRYAINGVLSTGDIVKNNLDKICLSSESWTSYDYGEGLWKLIPNRPIPVGELATAFEFNDDNILGEVNITATNLEDLYNILEIEFPSREIRDQNDYYRAAIDPALMNDLEPDNKLSMRLDLVNNALHAARVGLIELKQSRADLIITFKSDYTALQCSAGDVIKITNSVYGFTDELFRITKIREVEDDVGGISTDITATKYNADVYVDEILLDSSAVEGSGIPTFGGSATLPAPSEPIITSVNTSTRSFVLSTTIDLASGPVNEIQWFYSTNTASGYTYLTNEVNTSGNFGAGTTVSDNITILTQGNYYFKARSGLGSRYGDLSVTSDLLVLTDGADFGTIVP